MKEKLQDGFVKMDFVEPFELKIDMNGYKIHWNVIKLNWLQKILLRLLGIKITKYKVD